MENNKDYKLELDLVEWEIIDRIRLMNKMLSEVRNKDLRAKKKAYLEILDIVRRAQKGAV